MDNQRNLEMAVHKCNSSHKCMKCGTYFSEIHFAFSMQHPFTVTRFSLCLVCADNFADKIRQELG